MPESLYVSSIYLIESLMVFLCLRKDSLLYTDKQEVNKVSDNLQNTMFSRTCFSHLKDAIQDRAS